MLRSSNNPNTDIAIMTILKPLLVPNTQLAATSTSGTGLELVYIQSKWKMALNMNDAIPIALLLSSGVQEYSNEAQRAYIGIVPIMLDTILDGTIRIKMWMEYGLTFLLIWRE